MIKFMIGEQDFDSHIFEPMKVGETHIITVSILNQYNHNITLGDAFAEDDELEIKTFTSVIAPGQKGELVLEFVPSENRPAPCDCSWGFNTIIIG